MRKRIIIAVLFLFGWVAMMAQKKQAILTDQYGLQFNDLPKSWDEAIPLGNGMLGQLVWQKDRKLRFSLDRADLWDLRPMKIENLADWNYQWIVKQRKKDNFQSIIKSLDRLYDDNPAPTKIPGAALEFGIQKLGEIQNVLLNSREAICEINWKNGAQLRAFVQADENNGWFRFTGVDKTFKPEIVPPAYDKGDISKSANSLNTQDLITLGYKQGIIKTTENSQSYIQEGWGGFRYHVYVEWNYNNGVLEGNWSISVFYPKWSKMQDAATLVSTSFKKGFDTGWKKHQKWWTKFWNQSSISIPDTLLEKQWYLEMYKFGSAARKNAPPVALQAIWTADNGSIPPWKGDYHHDLNTQLCYWLSYSGNHLDLEQGFIDWLWRWRHNFKKFTRTFYGTDGINVPGSSSIEGLAMGGWSQYAYSPTISAWLGHHFYLHWRYSMDRRFLKDRAYPWLYETGIFLEQLLEKDASNKFRLPISSSPEIYNNEARAWFYEITNYDLALIRWTFEKAGELAAELGKKADVQKWNKLLSQCPEFAVDKESGLMFAPGFPANESHRHLSHILAIHPLGTLHPALGEKERIIIDNTIRNLKELGTSWWTGYTFSWFAGVLARHKEGDAAADMLNIFAQNFCLSNSFHVNGEQHKRGYSNFDYKPFTIEGNFAFAAALQEMLLQSHTGTIEIFPAIPEKWTEAGFNQLRAEGAFLVSAQKSAGIVDLVEIVAETDGTAQLRNPFPSNSFNCDKKFRMKGDIILITLKAGEKVLLTNTDVLNGS